MELSLGSYLSRTEVVMVAGPTSPAEQLGVQSVEVTFMNLCHGSVGPEGNCSAESGKKKKREK